MSLTKQQRNRGFIYFILVYVFVINPHHNKTQKHMTVNWCGLNDQHRVMSLMCGHKTAAYKEQYNIKITQ